MKHKILIILVLSAIYFLFKNYIPYGSYLLYPINLLVTFLHEFGHALGAIITGGSIKAIEINSDGSGFAITQGGIISIILMGGYIGSAIFGNLLLYFGLTKSKHSEKIIYFLGGLMIFTAIFLFNSIFSSLILISIGIILIFLAKSSKFDSILLSFLGVVSLFYIIEDFNVGPSSDLAKFSEIFVIFPQNLWMYIWLIIVLLITLFNFKIILKK